MTSHFYKRRCGSLISVTSYKYNTCEGVFLLRDVTYERTPKLAFQHLNF